VSFGGAVGFVGLAAFRKMLHGVWGVELPQDNRPYFLYFSMFSGLIFKGRFNF